MGSIEKRGTATTLTELATERRQAARETYNFDVKNAVDMLQDAITNDQQITIVGDYDCDGICASAIIARALMEMGARPAVIIPLRFTEGYGLKPVQIDRIDEGLVITVDNGINAFDAISAAKAKGLDVIVTDHHLPTVVDGQIKLPDADCIIDPHVEKMQRHIDGYINEDKDAPYTFSEYCGAGVALKIAEELLGKDHEAMGCLYAYASIATVADVMPLVEDNRQIFLRGVQEIADGNITEGLFHLFVKNGVNIQSIPSDVPIQSVITGDTMGFKIGPCFNAASRMKDDGAMDVLRGISTNKTNKALIYAAGLVSINQERKMITDTEYIGINEKLINENKTHDCPIVVYSKDTAPGIIGLHAGKLCEQYRTPAIVIGGEGEACKGSARSIEGIHIKYLLDEVSDLLVGYGGHEGAAGLTIDEKNIEEFTKRLQDICRERGYEPKPEPPQYFDVRISAANISDAARTIGELGPFGEGNPSINVLVDDFVIADAKVMAGKHIKLTDENGNQAIGFNMATGLEIPPQLQPGNNISLLGSLEYNVFAGNATPQLSIMEIPTEEQLIAIDRQEAEQDIAPATQNIDTER